MTQHTLTLAVRLHELGVHHRKWIEANMDEPLLLTAVIPVTKMAGKLEKFQKVISQCRQSGVKLVVVHDVRDTETGIELQNLLKTHGPKDAIYLQGHYGSAGLARNAGLESCATKWVCFWDSDDYIYVNNFLNMITKADTEKSDIAIGLLSIHSSQNNRKISSSEKLQSNNTLDLQISNFPAFTRMGFRTKNISKDPFPNIPMGEDLIFLLRQEIFGKKIYLYHQEVYCYFMGDPNQSTKLFDNSENFSKLLQIIFEILNTSNTVDERFVLAFANKLFLSNFRKVMQGKHQMLSWELTKKIIFVNLRTPIKALYIFIYIFTHRSNIIRATHG